MDVDVIDVDLLAGKDVVGTLRFREAQVAVGSASAGDLVLTDESLRRLGPWFAARGWPEYAAAAESTLQRRAARTAHDAKIAAILGEVRLVALREAMSDVAIGRALRDLAPTAEERATLGIRAYRVADGDDSPSDIDRRLRRYLRDVEEPAAVVAALDRMLASPADALAAAWYLQSVGDARRFDAGWFAKARLKAARTLLASDDPRLRAAAMRVFRELGDPATAPDLMRVLPAASADGTPVTPPTQLQVDAATLLARWCEAAALPRLRAIVAAAPGDDAAREEAMRRFEQAAAVKR
jgi:hypothetical protein